MKICVLLTKGADPANFRLPDEDAKARAAVAAQLLGGDSTMALCIIGGYPDFEGKTLADRLESYFRKQYPDLANRILVVDGRTNNTVDDLHGLDHRLTEMGYVASSIELILVSRPGHCKRVERTVTGMGFKFSYADSGEPISRGAKIQDKIGLFVSTFDPDHVGPAGKALRWVADRFAARHFDRSEQQYYEL